jgi:general nucleoside transport system permease protein
MDQFFGLFNAELLSASVRIATPLILAALGGLLCMRASVFNIALEGMMLTGAFFAIVVVDRTGSTPLGLVGGVISGIVVGVIFAVATIRFKADHIVTGIAINLGAIGVTGFALKAIFGISGQYQPSNMKALDPIDLPFVRDIPILGPMLNNHTPVIYLSLLMVVVTQILLFRTPFGLAVRSVGEYPDAARTSGIWPERVQWLVILWSGALCGLAGAHLSTGYVSQFTERMSAGRGFTAFTAIVFGASHPVYTFIACLIFGFAEALGFRIQLEGFGLPPSLVQAFPYVLAIVVLTVSSAIRMRRVSAMKVMTT